MKSIDTMTSECTTTFISNVLPVVLPKGGLQGYDTMINNNTPLLAAFGIGMGFSADDMHDMIIDVYASVSENENVSPLDGVADVTKGMDTKTLWIGAMLYGYILDSYEGIDVLETINQRGDEQ